MQSVRDNCGVNNDDIGVVKHALCTVGNNMENMYSIASRIVNRNQIRVTLYDYVIVATIDTGATISTINDNTFEKIKSRSKIIVNSCNKQCVLADGSMISLSRMITLPIKIANVDITIRVYILQNQQLDMIIGCDSLKQLGAKIDFDSKQLIVNNNMSERAEQLSLGVLQCAGNSTYNDYVVKLNDRVKAINLADSDTTEEQKKQLITLMNKYEKCFANNLMELGRTSVMEYDIETVDNLRPIKIRPYKCGYKDRDIIHKQIKDLLEAGLIKPAHNSEWGFPTVLVSKRDTKEMRCVLDVRKINEQTLEQPYILHNMNFLLADIGKRQSKYFSLIDLSKAYYQIPLSERSKRICTWSTIIGDYQSERAVFGLRNLPFAFSKLLNTIFFTIRGKFMEFFLDDIIIYSADFMEHIKHIEEVLERLRMANLTASPAKTFLCKKEVRYLGYMLSKDGVATTDDNVCKIKNFPIPNKQKHVRMFLGVCNFFRHFVKDYGKIAKPLYDLTKKQQGKFVWTDSANKALETLKHKLTTTPILAYPNLESKERLILCIDSSSIGIGYLLSQFQPTGPDNKLMERPISYGSTPLSGAQRKMGSTDLELSGVCFALKKLDCWLRGTKFKLITDHKSLTYLMAKRIDEMKPAVARKVIFLQQYDFEMVHKMGRSIFYVDNLSRWTRDDVDNEYEDIEPEINVIHDNIVQKQTPLDLNELGLKDVTLDKVRVLQKHDMFFNGMYQYLDSGVLPRDKTIARRIKTHKELYVIDNNLLYHIWTSRSAHIVHKQLCIPVELRRTVLSILHDTKLAGHKSVNKMFHEAISRIFWNSMYRDMQDYVSSCKICLEANRGKPPHIPMKASELPIRPFHKIAIDVLRIPTPSRGYQYILVIVDLFSRLVIAEPTKRKSAKHIIGLLYSKFILKFGFFKELLIQSDNGTEMCNAYSAALYKLLGIHSITTSYYKPNSNGIVEKQNSQILGLLRRYVKDNPKKWATSLDYVTYVINSSVCESTKKTPFSLVFGLDTVNILDLCFPDHEEIVPKNMQQAYHYWFENLTSLRKLAQQNMIITKQTQKIQYDKKARDHLFKLNDKVLIKIKALKDGEDYKLSPKYKGYYTIEKFIGDTNVILKDQNGKTLAKSVYINDLKKFSDRNVINNTMIESEYDSDDTIIDGAAGDHQEEAVDDRDITQEEVTVDTQKEVPVSQRMTQDGVGASQAPEGLDDMDVEEDNGNVRPEVQEEDLDQSLPFSQLDDRALQRECDVETDGVAEDCSREDSQTENTGYEKIKKVYRKKVMPSGDIQYYLSWADYPAKKYRCWVSRSDLSDELKKFVDNKKLPCT